MRCLTSIIALFAMFWLSCPPVPARPLPVSDETVSLPAVADGEKNGSKKGAKKEKPSTRAKNRQRWKNLPEEKRRHLEKKYEQFKKRSPEEQKKLKQRHDELVRLREALIERHQRELNLLPPEDREKRIRALLKEEIEKKARQIKEKRLPPTSRQRPPEGDTSRRLQRALEKENCKLADRILARLLEEETISRREWDRHMSLSPRERISHVVELEKTRCLDALEGVLSPVEMERLKNMKARPFHFELNRQRRERGMPGALRRLSDLTPEQLTALKDLPDSARDKRKRLFFEANMRRRLLEMGVPAEKMKGLFSLPLRQRIERIKSLIREVPKEKVPAELQKLIRTPHPRRPGMNGSSRKNGQPRSRGVRNRPEPKQGSDEMPTFRRERKEEGGKDPATSFRPPRSPQNRTSR